MNRREWNLALSGPLQSVKAGNKSLVAARHQWNRSVCRAVSQITQGIAVPGTICRHRHRFKCCCLTVISVQGYIAATKLPPVLAAFSVTATNSCVAAAQSFQCKGILQQQNYFLFWQWWYCFLSLPQI